MVISLQLLVIIVRLPCFVVCSFSLYLINVAGIINSTLVLAWPGSNHVLQSPTLLLK